MMRKTFYSALGILLFSIGLSAQDDVVKLGIIGLDTSHSTAFTELLNSESDDPYVRRFEIVAAYPYGSRTIESSYRRIAGYTEEVKKYGVTICDSISEMLDMVDCVLLETNDGRLHVEQAVEVFKSGKLCYVDKPAGATLGQTMALYRLADYYGIPIFSSSALRYSTENVKLRNGEYGKVLGADCYSPHHFEATHPDFGFYGIHGVETLYTIMGRGCKSVSRIHSDYGDIVSGVWEDGRLGTFRAVSIGPNIYGGTAITETGTVQAGGYMGYKVLLDKILDYFLTGAAPVEPEETIEIFAFMKASNMSLERGGAAVSLEEAYGEGEKEAQELLKAYLPISLNVLAPGHFHASLLQKHMQEGIAPQVDVYAPEGPELQSYLTSIESFNSREENPTSWEVSLHTGDAFLQSLPAAGKNEAVLLAGNNRDKSDYISESVKKGYNVLSDKPMAISRQGYEKLVQAYGTAGDEGLVLMDLMTERYDAVNIITRDLLNSQDLFGTLDLTDGVPVRISSVHHFYKEVGGIALTRPAWYYDVGQQGEGIADVTTHLIDLFFWQCFPGQAVYPEDIRMTGATHYPTVVSAKQFYKSTGVKAEFDKLPVMCNGSLEFAAKGVPVRIDVRWNWSAPKGGGDTFEAVYKGSKCDLRVRQDKNSGFQKEIVLSPEADVRALESVLAKYPGTTYRKLKSGELLIVIPESMKVGHEDHFNLVAKQFFNYMRGEKMPLWESVNTLSKYYITTSALEMASRND